MVYTVSKHFSDFGLFWRAHNPRHIDSADIFCGIANLRPLLLIGLLTMILPCEVKVHLANFDVKLRTKFLYTGFFQNWLIPAETSCKSFWTSDMTSKNDVLMSILTFFIRSSVTVGLHWPSPSNRFYCHYRPPEHGRSPEGPGFAV